MSTWAAHTGTHAGHAASAAAAAAAAASGPGNPNAALRAAAQQLDQSCGWFSNKMKAIVPLLLRGKCLGQAVGVGDKDPAAGAGHVDQQGGVEGTKSCVWGGSAMVFVKRKVGIEQMLALYHMLNLSSWFKLFWETRQGQITM